MASILKRREAGTSQGFNGFDMSHKSYFTSSVGMILPIHWDKLQPKDKIRINTSVFSRLEPSNSASPIALTNHVDYFFIPYRFLFSLMPSMLADVNDWHSTMMERTAGDNNEDYPHFQLDYAFMRSAGDFLLTEGTKAYNIEHVQGFFVNTSFELDARILLQMFNYGDFGKDYHKTFEAFAEHVRDPDHPGQYLGWTIPDDIALRYYDVMPLLAYQCVWQWYYRLDTREELNRDSYNCDKYYQQVADPVTGILPWTTDFDFFDTCPFLKLQYRPWKRDFFTSNEISPLGTTSSYSHYRTTGANTNFTKYIRQWLDSFSNGEYLVSEPDGGTLATDRTNATEVSWIVKKKTQDGVDYPYQTTQQHRIAAVIEKLSAIWQQTGKTYKDQIEKQFGINLGDHLSSRPIYVGSHSSTFDMKPIVADVETSEMPAGTITGYGVASSDDKQKPIDFEAPEHGIFLALYSTVPEAIYRPIGLDFAHTYQSRADFPLPVTDELGQRPLFNFEIQNTASATQNNARRGWLARHQELKLKQDMRFLGFDTTRAFWIPARTADQVDGSVQSYYVRPDYLDDIMLVSFQDFNQIDDLTYKWLDDSVFDGHPIDNFVSINCFKSSKQSTYGVPQNFFG